MSILAGVLAVLIGITLGMLGGGGSILTVPTFVYAMGIDPKQAIVMSLPVVGGAALVGAVQHWRKGNVSLAMALPFGVAAMGGAFLGARAAAGINGHAQLVLLAVVMIAAATSMAWNALSRKEAKPAAKQSRAMLVALGFVVGGLTGVVGAGGGFLIVPALVVLGGVPMAHAAGTSLIVIAMNTTSAFLGYHGSVDVPWPVVLRFGLLCAAGIVAGTALGSRVPQRALKLAFAGLLVAVGALMLYQYYLALST